MVTQAANVTNASIAAYAERVGRHHDIYDTTGRADLFKLLEVLGGQIDYADGEESLDVRDHGDFTILLPQYTSVSRDRFTAAHELGHYFLHYLYPKHRGPEKFKRGDRNRAETEANIFASALLMPAEEFKRVWRESGGDEWYAAQHFDVSPAAARVRAEVLRLS